MLLYMHPGQGSKVSILKQETWKKVVLKQVTLQVETFLMLYLVYLYNKFWICSCHGLKPFKSCVGEEFEGPVHKFEPLPNLTLVRWKLI